MSGNNGDDEVAELQQEHLNQPPPRVPLSRDLLQQIPHHVVTAAEAATISKDGGCCCCLEPQFSAGEEVAQLPTPGCRHRFHWHCLQGWFSHQNWCPLCRRAVSAGAPSRATARQPGAAAAGGGQAAVSCTTCGQRGHSRILCPRGRRFTTSEEEALTAAFLAEEGVGTVAVPQRGRTTTSEEEALAAVAAFESASVPPGATPHTPAEYVYDPNQQQAHHRNNTQSITRSEEERRTAAFLAAEGEEASAALVAQLASEGAGNVVPPNAMRPPPSTQQQQQQQNPRQQQPVQQSSAGDEILCEVCGDPVVHLPPPAVRCICSKGHGLCREHFSDYIKITWVANVKQNMQQYSKENPPAVQCSVPGCTSSPFTRGSVVSMANQEAEDAFFDVIQDVRDMATLAEAQRLVQNMAGNAGGGRGGGDAAPAQTQRQSQEDAERQRRRDVENTNHRLLELQLRAQARGGANNMVQCPRCNFGPLEMREYCGDMNYHQGQNGLNNACPQCQFLPAQATDWREWDGFLRMQPPANEGGQGGGSRAGAGGTLRPSEEERMSAELLAIHAAEDSAAASALTGAPPQEHYVDGQWQHQQEHYVDDADDDFDVARDFLFGAGYGVWIDNPHDWRMQRLFAALSARDQARLVRRQYEDYDEEDEEESDEW